MIRYLLFLASRLAIAAFALLTWAYSVSTFSPFAFDMFVRPQIFPWLGTFVTWHHIGYWAAYLLSLGTLGSDLGSSRDADAGTTAARWMGWGYAVVGGAIGVYLMQSLYLPSLSPEHPSYLVALMPLLPLAWLAAIDHLATRRWMVSSEGQRPPTNQRRLLLACAGAAVIVWLTHFGRAVWRDAAGTDMAGWSLTAAWALVLDLMMFMVLYVGLNLVTVVAASLRRPRFSEYAMAVVLLAIGACEFLRQLVFPALSFDATNAFVISAGTGVTLAGTWSGLRMRRIAVDGDAKRLGIELLIAPVLNRATVAIALLVAVPLVMFAAFDRVEQMDWDFLQQKMVVIVGGILIAGIILALSRTTAERAWSVRRLAVLPLLSLALLHAMPMVATALAARSDGQLAPEVLLDRYTALDPAFRFAAGRLVAGADSNLDYYRDLRSTTQRPNRQPPHPSAEAAVAAGEGPLPHIFMFVIDGLRRDYLSPYNPLVRFTPSIDEWAAESLVFRNAFTRYGGTWLAMPSIWAGGEVTRDWSRDSFARINAIEKLVVANDYQIVINDHTVASTLRPDRQRTFLDPDVKSIDTDICHLVDGLQEHMTSSASDRRPIFTFLSPMNVYLLNNSRSARTSAAGLDGFYEPYAASVQRLDACFGRFITHLKQTGVYDNSVIVITSDHGESLGENGNWGHQYWLFPEDLRIPLMVHVPERLRVGLTADLGRISFSTDIAPSLYALLGYDVPNHGPRSGAPLLVANDGEPVPRRRESFLVRSSYGPSFGLLRRNGRFLYISDLINLREYAFELFREPLGKRVGLTDDLRRVNQALLYDRVTQVEGRLTRPEPSSSAQMR